jgi:hypothetical protein
MRLMAALALAGLIGGPAGAKEAAVKGVDAVATYAVPKEWDLEKDAAAADPSVRLTRGRHVIEVRLYGGKGSRFATPKEFINGPAAGAMGKPPQPIGSAPAGGVKTTIYKTAYPINLGDPHDAAGRFDLADEYFCIVPAKDRFLVISYAYESAVPDPAINGNAVWKDFLAKLRVRKK